MSIGIVTRSYAPYRFKLYEELNSLEDGGAVVFIERLASSAHAWTNDSISLHEVPLVETGTGWKGLLSLWGALNTANSRKMIIHEYSIYTVLSMIWALWNSRPFFIYTENGDDPPAYARKWFTVYWHRFWKTFCSGVIACTEDARVSAQAMCLPCVFAPHAVDSKEYQVRSNFNDVGDVTILFVGALNERKGIMDLLEVCERIAHGFKLLIAGGGELKNLITEKWGDEEWLEYCGFLESSELRELYEVSDVFVLPSYADTYAVVVHEAVCAGLPVVVTNETGASKNLVSTDNGFKYDAGDKERLYECVTALVDDAFLRKRFSLESRKLGEEYCVSNISERVFKFVSFPVKRSVSN